MSSSTHFNCTLSVSVDQSYSSLMGSLKGSYSLAHKLSNEIFAYSPQGHRVSIFRYFTVFSFFAFARVWLRLRKIPLRSDS